MVYIIRYGATYQLFHSEEKALAFFTSKLKEDWGDCIKYSCPKGEFYDDRGFTLKECLKYKDAVINKVHYQMIPCLFVD